MSLSVATRNPFSILDDEDASPPATPAPTKETSSAPSRGTQKPRGNAPRGGRYPSRGGARPALSDQAQNGVDEPSSEPRRFEGGRGRGRGRGGDRGERGERGERGGGGGGGRGGRRAFDRHSQTGKTDSDKKIHQGWGGDDGQEEFKTEQAATVDATAESNAWAGEAPAADWGGGASTADWGAPPPAETTTATAAEEDKGESRPRREREEEEDHTLTLEQYLAQQKEKDLAVPKLDNTRKANEGADDNIWKDAVPLTKDEEKESYFVGKTKSAPKARTKKEEKVFIEIDAHFERPDRGGRGRGGRGRGDRGRGGGRERGGGGNRGDRQTRSSAPVAIDDETAFPSLS